MAREDSRAGEALLLIEGVIAEVHASRETETFYDNIAARFRDHRPIAGVSAAAGERYGRAAAAAAIAVRAGEDMECFFCLVGDQVICGALGGASRLPTGKVVKAVVERRGESLIAQAILSESDGLVWTLRTQGHKAYWLETWRFGWWGFLSPLIIMLALAWLMDDLDADHFRLFTQGSVIWAVLIFGFTWKDAGPMKPLSDPTADVFRMLGFARPENVSLSGYQYSIVHRDLVRSVDWDSSHSCIYSVAKALEDGKLKRADQ